MPLCDISRRTRAAAVMHASVPANMLTSTPTSISVPNMGTPATPASTCIGRLAGAQVLPDGVKAQRFGVSADRKENACDDGALDHGARNGSQRIARLGAQRGRALEPHKAEERHHQTETQAASRHAAQLQLLSDPDENRGAQAPAPRPLE